MRKVQRKPSTRLLLRLSHSIIHVLHGSVTECNESTVAGKALRDIKAAVWKINIGSLVLYGSVWNLKFGEFNFRVNKRVQEGMLVPHRPKGRALILPLL